MNLVEEGGEVKNDRRKIAICKRNNGVRDTDSPVDCDRCSYAQSLGDVYVYSWILWKKRWGTSCSVRFAETQDKT